MRRTLIAIALVICMSAPIAAANWSYRGSNEPDTAYDLPSFMFYDPDESEDQSLHKIYFNVFTRLGRYGHYNANVALVGSTMQQPVTAPSGVLGFWKDCNRDGYIGQIETITLEYRAELLLDDEVCPRTLPVPNQAVYPHNDGTWIREFIWIGPTANGGAVGNTNDNPTNFLSDGTAIWGDWGLPGASPVLTCQGAANFGLRSTGTIIDVIDCQTYFKGVRTLNTVQDETGAPVGGWEMRDIDNSPSPLNVDNPAYAFLYGPAEPDGHPEEGDYRGYSGGILGRDTNNNVRRERMVTVVDCQSDTVRPSTSVATPGDVTDPATYPSLYESLNDTYEVAAQSPNNSNGQNACNPDGPGDEGLPYTSAEGFSEHTFAEAGRVEVDHVFKFSPGNRNFPAGAVAGQCRPSSPATPNYNPGPLGYCPPADLGLAVERDDLAVGPGWRTNANIITYTITTRDQALRTDSPDFGGWYMTFYASIGASARTVGQLPGGDTFTYGDEACGDHEGGIHNDWNCDPAAWIARCADGETPTLTQHCYRVGFKYQLRDIDCWDNTVVRGSGVRAGLADVSDSGPCALNEENGSAIPLG